MITCQVVNELHTGKYVVLMLDQDWKREKFNSIEIEGKDYPVLPAYGISEFAIESTDSFIGKKITLK